MRASHNPFAANDPDRRFVWEMLVARDSQAFVDADWSSVSDDFAADCFEGLSANGSLSPDDWTIAYPTLEDYRNDWERMGKEFAALPLGRLTPGEFLLGLSSLDRIDIAGDRALVHKKFRADEPLANGGRYTIASRTLYRLHRIAARWKIVGFIAGLPLQAPEARHL